MTQHHEEMIQQNPLFDMVIADIIDVNAEDVLPGLIVEKGDSDEDDDSVPSRPGTPQGQDSAQSPLVQGQNPALEEASKCQSPPSIPVVVEDKEAASSLEASGKGSGKQKKALVSHGGDSQKLVFVFPATSPTESSECTSPSEHVRARLQQKLQIKESSDEPEAGMDSMGCTVSGIISDERVFRGPRNKKGQLSAKRRSSPEYHQWVKKEIERLESENTKYSYDIQKLTKELDSLKKVSIYHKDDCPDKPASHYHREDCRDRPTTNLGLNTPLSMVHMDLVEPDPEEMHSLSFLSILNSA